MTIPDVSISIDEYVETLKRSSLSTVITEGKDDYRIFRRLERKLTGVSFMPVGGKSNVLRLFNRRHEFSQIKTAFVVDKDVWVFTGIPESYQSNDLFYTDGYSIENDLYRDGELEDLLLDEERSRFWNDLKEILRWYSFAISERINGKEAEIKFHPDRIIDEYGKFKEEFLQLTGFAEPHEDTLELLKGDYARLLRGKTLLALLIRYLSHSKRETRHNRNALMEVACTRSGKYLSELYENIRVFFEFSSTNLAREVV